MSIVLPENRLLEVLPAAELTRLVTRMTEVAFGHKEMIYRAGGPIDFVYFPRGGLLSAVVIMDDGSSVEVAAVGLEGMVGAASALGATVSGEQVFCQVYPAVCRKMPIADFVAEIARGGALHDLISRYLRAALNVSARQTACNALHSVDERCARWLLRCHDAVGADEFALTHEFLSVMLGVRRATVSVSAGNLQNAGIIAYRHGRVTVLDRERLEEATCECYAAIRTALGLSS